MSDSKVPLQLFSMQQLAEFVERHPVYLRELFARGVLAEPANSVSTGKRVTRRFTLAEMERMKVFFANVKYGSLSKAAKRATQRRARR